MHSQVLKTTGDPIQHSEITYRGRPVKNTRRRSMYTWVKVFPGCLVVKNPPGNAGDAGSVPGLGRSPAGANGNPHQYSCLKTPMDREACPVHGVANSQTWLSVQAQLNHVWLHLQTQHCEWTTFQIKQSLIWHMNWITYCIPTIYTVILSDNEHCRRPGEGGTIPHFW